MKMVLDFPSEVVFVVGLRESVGGVAITLTSTETKKEYSIIDILDNGTINRFENIPADTGLPIDKFGRLMINPGTKE